VSSIGSQGTLQCRAVPSLQSSLIAGTKLEPLFGVFRSANGALLMRELTGASAQRSVESCAEVLLLQHAVSHYCPLPAGAKSTIAATYISGTEQQDVLATSQ
jgi:hypothetical protein